MDTALSNRFFWMEEGSRAHSDQIQQTIHGFSNQDYVQEVQHSIRRFSEEISQNSLQLYAGTNVMSPAAEAALSSQIGSLPSMGHPGNKYQTGLAHTEKVEVIMYELINRVFGSIHGEFRLFSGTLANAAVIFSYVKPGESIMVLPEWAGGHASHHQVGVAGHMQLDIQEIPYDAANMTVDVTAFAAKVKEVKPKLVIVGGSLALTRYPVREMKEICQKQGAILLYDAAHLSGLIAGREYQLPLEEGADVMTMSTYKSLGGPPGGLIVTKNPEVARRIDRVTYPGFVANYDANRICSLAISLAETAEFGQAYAKDCIKNAQLLAAHLADNGLPVLQPVAEYTQTHHVAIDARPFGGGGKVARDVEPSGILFSGIELPGEKAARDNNGIRIGVQEVTRWGMKPDEMKLIAEWTADAVFGRRSKEEIKRDVVTLRKSFQQVHYCF
ncbi:serine hydroxymethyltransferase [Brevibacillus sp. B_LB10_24]|uniref:serine hydroxymethyltransferase n=1 Tax=Brevibacillus sp. B_LB10_24 TaxID=3380645 RepID=UPI0038BE1A95